MFIRFSILTNLMTTSIGLVGYLQEFSLDIESALRTAFRKGARSELGEDEVIKGILEELNNRRFTVDDWMFDVKLLKAIKVSTYGDPYTAVATFTITGDVGYVDSLLNKEGTMFNRDDVRALTKVGKKLGLASIKFDRIRNGKTRTVTIDLTETKK